jgi:hypothetical protein
VPPAGLVNAQVAGAIASALDSVSELRPQTPQRRFLSHGGGTERAGATE